MFQPPRDRDAFASIRGYMFQVDRTVERWLTLTGEQILELERGEDIDLVGQLVDDSGASNETRLLEQIKRRETNITLRTQAALEALANFHDHRISNPSSDLRFCFITNASVGTERLNPFSNGTPGIALWEQVRTSQLADSDTVTAVENLRRFLITSSQPDNFSDAVWKAWQSYLSSVAPVDFRVFIERFEWSTGHPDADSTPVLLQTMIRELGFAATTIEADSLADRLVVHVCRLLSVAGLKRLTVADRSQLLTAPTLESEDRTALASLRSLVSSHGDRLDVLEADVSSIQSVIEGIFLPGSEHIQHSILVPDISLPLPLSRICHRGDTIEDLCKVLQKSVWIALHGGPDGGKSQLATQIAFKQKECIGWLRFHNDQSMESAIFTLEASLMAVARWDRVPSVNNWYPLALSQAKPGAVLVLDDLPRIPSDHVLLERLHRLCEAAFAARCNLVSTSQYELPQRLRNTLGLKLEDRIAPAFSKEDAWELFRTFGAPDIFFSEKRIRFLNDLAAGHPLLLTATAAFLAGRNWQYREEDVNALLRGDHKHSILPEVIDRLTRSLADNPRELLYRLTLPIGAFTYDDIVALASVSPAIGRPLECLNDLVGAWIQRDSDNTSVVSPLARPLGRTELSKETRRLCYRELSDVITRRKEMNPFEIERAILYNLEASESGRAITLFVLLLASAVKEKRVDYIVSIISMWRTSELPVDLSVGNQLLVRAYQLAAFTKYGVDATFILKDIDRLLSLATDRDGWGIIALAAVNLSRFGRKDPRRIIIYISRAIALPEIYGPDGRVIVFDRVAIPELLWMPIADLSSPAIIQQWIDAADAIPESYREKFWKSEISRQAIWLVANKVYLLEWEKPKEKQHWDKLLSDLAIVLTRAQALRQPRLEAAITGVMIDILGDRKRLDDIPALANATLERWPGDPDVQFKVRGTWGRNYAYKKRQDEALALLDAALTQNYSRNDHETLRCLLAASTCVDDRNLSYAEKARDLARDSTEAPDIEACRALGEYAISVFQTIGGQKGAISVFLDWSQVIKRFWKIQHKSKIWRDVFPLFAHATSFFANWARDGAPPSQSQDGSAFVEPKRGFLLKDYMPEREALYRKSSESAIALLLGSYASAAGYNDETAYWMKLAMDEARKTGATFIQVTSGSNAIGELLVSGNYEDAIELGVYVGRGLVVERPDEMKPRNFEGVGVDLQVEYKKLPQDKRWLGDSFALITGVIPTVIRLIHLSLENPDSALSAGRKVAAMCQQMAQDSNGDQELWQYVHDLLELSCNEDCKATDITSRIRDISGNDERANTLTVYATVIAAWHASPDQAIGFQLSAIQILFRWYSAAESIRRRVLTPYIEAYWRFVSKNQRFVFRAPDYTVAAIESAANEPEANRIFEVLTAASNGFRIHGAHNILQNIRRTQS